MLTPVGRRPKPPWNLAQPTFPPVMIPFPAAMPAPGRRTAGKFRRMMPVGTIPPLVRGAAQLKKELRTRMSFFRVTALRVTPGNCLRRMSPLMMEMFPRAMHLPKVKRRRLNPSTMPCSTSGARRTVLRAMRVRPGMTR